MLENGFLYTNTALVALLERDAENEWLEQGGTKNDVTTIGYDQAALDASFTPAFVMGKVAWTQKPGVGKTHFSYDERGRLVQGTKDLAETGFALKTSRYYYDSPSGQPSMVAYQEGQSDAFYHHYTYDKHGRISQVHTSLEKNATIKEKQAEYQYYLTGGLKRTELADKLQGLDYTYTIQGQLKAINTPYRYGANEDPNQDGILKDFAQDVFGIALNYHLNDYKAAVGYGLGFSNHNFSQIRTGAVDRFDGQLKNVQFANHHKSSQVNIDVYSYDAKNQLSGSSGLTAYKGSVGVVVWNTMDKGVSEATQYDPQGNIKYKERNNEGDATQSTSLEYKYKAHTNQLEKVVYNTQDRYTFTYDAVGRVVERTKGFAVQRYVYDASDKVVEVRNGNNVLRTAYVYDEYGQKVAKKMYSETGILGKTEYYSYDPNGVLMAIYVQEGQATKLREVPLYGMDRLGVLYLEDGTANTTVRTYTYEIKDHLGSVRATLLRDKTSQGKAEVIGYGEYFGYGAEVNDRSLISSFGKRYGFQGEWAEKDRNVTELTEFELRHYDADLGRWMVPDPYNQYHSPYLAMGNDPVNSVDPDGGWSWTTAAIGAGIGAAVGYAASDGDWRYTLAGAIGGGLIGGASFNTTAVMGSAGSETSWMTQVGTTTSLNAFGEVAMAGVNTMPNNINLINIVNIETASPQEIMAQFQRAVDDAARSQSRSFNYNRYFKGNNAEITSTWKNVGSDYAIKLTINITDVDRARFTLKRGDIGSGLYKFTKGIDIGLQFKGNSGVITATEIHAPIPEGHTTFFQYAFFNRVNNLSQKAGLGNTYETWGKW